MKLKFFTPIVLSLLLIGGACQKPTKTTNTTTSSTTPTFSSGIYHRFPNLNDPSAVLVHIDSPVGASITMSPVDYDISSTQAVYPDDAILYIVSPDGKKRAVQVKGIYQMARPTLSPDGAKVAVQATTTKHPGGEGADPIELKIFVVTLSDGSSQQISPESAVPNESPTWFNQSNKIVYSTFSAVDGVDIHIYDLDQNREVLTIENAGWHGLAVSKDDSKIFVPNSMRVYSTTAGELVTNLKEKAAAGITQAGFTLVDNIGDSGSPFLDGDWSPDGTQLVFDAVEIEHSEPHSMIFTMNSDGTNVKAITGPLDVNPDFSNNFNFSQVNPMWI